MSGQSAAPIETGERIGTIDRSETEQLRIVWAEYNGSPYVGVRLWTRDRRGHWFPDAKRGLAIRTRELGKLAEAIGVAIDRCEEIRAGWTTLPADHPARRSARRRSGPACIASEGG